MLSFYSNKYNIKDLAIFFLLIIIYLSPSRLWSFGFFDIDCPFPYPYKYLNLFILNIFILFLLTRNKSLCLAYDHLFKKDKQIYRIVLIIILIYLIIGYAIKIKNVYIIDEIIKLLVLFFIYNIVKNLLLLNKSYILYKGVLLSLVLLTLISYFSLNYKGFSFYGRAGTIGFGINETSLISSILLTHYLFKHKHTIIDILVIIMSIGTVFFTSSRRGAFFVIICFIFYIIFVTKRIITKLKSPIRLIRLKESISINDIKKIIFIYICFVILILILPFIKRSLELNKLPIMIRYHYLSNTSQLVFSDEIRKDILSNSFNWIKENYLFGALGSDLYLTNNVFFDYIHSHNLFVQLVAKYGIFLFILILILFIKKAILALNFMRNHNLFDQDENNIFILCSQGLLVYIFYDQFGYGLWHIKNLWLFSVFFFGIDEGIFKYSLKKRISNIPTEKR